MNDQTSSPKKDEARPEGEAAVNLTKDDIAPAPGVEEALRAEVAELNDRILRLAAEVENTRRRGEREKADAGRYAISNFARDLLTVADTFERALAAAPGEGEHATAETITSLLTGLKLTERELLSVLERNGVRRVYPKGEKFDPNLHQAVAQAPGSAPAGYVEEVAQPGFTIGDRVLRAAMVIVSTGPGSGSSEAGAGLDTRA
ncbi:MAG: nucleotide exchange factor GrpE [Parvularculaceae bacterium]